MKVLNEDIKNKNFKNIYLLYGNESFLKRSYKKRLKYSIVEEDNINFNYFEGDKISENDFIEICNTLPFFAENRCIIVENSKWFKVSKEKIINYIDNLPESTKLIFIENEVDKRSKLYKKVDKKGYISCLNHPEYKDLLVWAAGILKKSDKQISRADLDLFLSYIGNDMENIKCELDKLIAYMGDKEVIERQDIDCIVSVNPENKIFDMINAITSGKTAKALELYADLLALKEAPLKILALTSLQFNRLYRVKELVLEGKDKKTIGKLLGLADFVVSGLITRVKPYSKSILRNYLNTCIELEESVKSGMLNEQLALETLIVMDKN